MYFCMASPTPTSQKAGNPYCYANNLIREKEPVCTCTDPWPVLKMLFTAQGAVLLLHLPSNADNPLSVDGGVVW